MKVEECAREIGSAQNLVDALTRRTVWFPELVVSRGPCCKAPTMPRPYPSEFRARAIALVRSGRQVKQTAYELGISADCLHE